MLLFTNKKVLIVEDSFTVRYEVRLILEKLGITILEAANEVGMMNLMDEYGKPVDLVIMDLVLKNENGLDLIKKIKSSKSYSSIPVLILTENADKKSVLRAKELGVEGYLKKPINKEELISRVEKLLSPQA